MSAKTYALYLDPESEDLYVLTGGCFFTLAADFIDEGGRAEQMQNMSFIGRFTAAGLTKQVYPGVTA